MKRKQKDKLADNLPASAVEFIRLVIKKMRYRKKVRQDVQAELSAHFEDELKDLATDEEKAQKAQQLIAGFGDVKLLAVLLRRAKKRCRPLWRKALVRSLQVAGVIILYLLICFAPLVIGRPKISVNYVDWLNNLARADRDESENAYPYYKQAVAASVKIPGWLVKSRVKWPADFNDIEMEQFSRWINDNKEALDFLIEGTKRPHYWAVYRGTGNALITGNILDEDFMENLSEYKTLARALNWRSRYRAYRGDIGSALDDCVSSVRLGSHQQGKGLLIEQLVGVAIEALADGTIFMILEKTDVPADALKNLQEELKNQYRNQKPVFSFESEKAFKYDYIQRTFTDDGKGGGRMLVRGLPIAVGDWKDGVLGFVFFNYPDRKEVTETIDKFYRQADELLRETPWQAGSEDRKDELSEIAKDSSLLKLLGLSYSRIRNIVWRVKMHREALLTVLAIMRYEKEKGQYPASLDELVEADYLKELPMDAYSDAPLAYRRTDEGFLLYSFGTNLKDDGGKLGRGRKGTPKMWADDGDWVFWPVPKLQLKQ